MNKQLDKQYQRDRPATTSSLLCITSHSQRPQRTLSAPAFYEGLSGFTGQLAKVAIYPAAEDAGIVFEVSGKGEVPATAEFLLDSCIVDGLARRATALGKGNVSVYQVEHLLAALAGLCVTNARVVVNTNAEIPMFDGSAYEFASGIVARGIKEQGAPCRVVEVLSRFSIKLDDQLIEITPRADASLFISASIIFSGPIGLQSFEYTHSPEAFLLELARARTFQPHLFPGVRATKRYYAGFQPDGCDANLICHNKTRFLGHLRYRDEPVRHKIVDFLGDLSLSGAQLTGATINLYRPGHRVNGHLARALWEQTNQGDLS